MAQIISISGQNSTLGAAGGGPALTFLTQIGPTLADSRPTTAGPESHYLVAGARFGTYLTPPIRISLQTLRSKIIGGNRFDNKAKLKRLKDTRIQPLAPYPTGDKPRPWRPGAGDLHGVPDGEEYGQSQQYQS